MGKSVTDQPARRAVRPRRHYRYRPTAEALEAREAPAAGALGINVRVDFVDLVKQSQWWGPAAGASAVTRDAEGWPTADAQLLLVDYRMNMPWNGPDPFAVAPDLGGTYHLSFRGSATVAPPVWNQNLTVVNQSYNPTTNTTTAEVVVPPNAHPFLLLDFTGTANPESPTGAGVTDVRMIRPGYAPDNTQVFTDNLLDALEPFVNLRTLDAAAVNDYPVFTAEGVNSLDWSERRLPTDWSQTGAYADQVGVAWEYLVGLANDTDSDLWITVPGPATDDYVAQLASLVAHGGTVDGVFYPPLEPGLKVYVEYSNEVWGGIPNNRIYNQAAAETEVAAGTTAVNNDGVNDPWTWSERRYLERSAEVSTIFRAAFGGDPGFETVRPVLGWQDAEWSGGGWQYYRRTLDWFEAVYGRANRFFYGLGVANYWTPDTYASVDAIIESLRRGEAASVASALKMTAIANYYGMKNVAYEGGPGLGADGNTPAGQNALAALRDPRMADLVFQHYVNWYASGGEVAAFFAGPFGGWSPMYPWMAAELSQAADPEASPKYRGLLQLDAAPPVSATAGYRVDPGLSTTFPATVDALGRSFQNPSTGADSFWLLRAGAAGTYTVSLSTGATPGGPGGGTGFGLGFGFGGGSPSSAQPTGIVQVYLNNQAYGSPVTVRPNSLVDLADVPLREGFNTLRLVAVRGGYDPSAPDAPQRYAFAPVSISLRQSGPTAAVAAQGRAAGIGAATETPWWSPVTPAGLAGTAATTPLQSPSWRGRQTVVKGSRRLS